MSTAIPDCPQPDSRKIEPGSLVYTPPPWAQKKVGVALALHMDNATPGGIHRHQFTPAKHPIKTAFAAFPFVALVVLAIVAIVTRH